MIQVALLAALVLAAPCDRSGNRCSPSRHRQLRVGVGGAAAPAAPILLFADSTGTGMGAVCAGTTPTGTLGQTITLGARASNRTCMKGNENALIANGDMVILSANQYAVQPGGAGTGPLGISVWGSGKNWCPSSEALDSADWNAFGSGAAAPTITANFALSPRNQMTAERVQFAATTSGQSSFVYATAGCHGTETAKALSCYVRSTTTAGTIDLGWGGGSGGWTGLAGGCSHVPTSWTRCRLPGAGLANASLFSIGNMSAQLGTARSAGDVLISGCQCEDGYKVSPYMPTAIGGTATRDAESVTTTFTATASFSMAATVAHPYSFSDDVLAPLSISVDASHEVSLPIIGAKMICDINVGGTHSTMYGRDNFLDPVAEKASACTYASGTSQACVSSTCKSASGSLTLGTGAATVWIGGLQDGGTADATIKSVCVDSTGSGICKPTGASNVTCPATATESLMVAGIGNSIMVGQNSQVPVAQEFNDRLCASGHAFAQFAVSGSKIDSGPNNCALQYTTSIQGHGYRAVASNCGVNDILNGTSGHAAFTLYAALMDTIRGDGFPIVAGYLTPCNGYSGCSGKQTDISDFNSDLAAYCVAHAAQVTCRDQASLLANVTTLTFIASSYTLGSQCTPGTDNLHPNSYCSMLLADDFADHSP